MKEIILKPVITEKSMSGTSMGRYAFKVKNNANKIEIKKVIKEVYKVDPISVNIINMKGKEKKWRGRTSGKTSDWKKAIITIKKGQKIAGFEVK
ncbi:50S ribosomal protein L23 [Candidatus Berkelbacteria bacterium RIFCSPHIGHO2_12_FULL_36_9]|uniref:Large ribosomal subunit protein uL23 n=1 Tax=Candidatus Berkelbacteria bacterium RIFCSPHIGHO2_12_FULL_36_9 TaxID=1797469 RepID=A0A1F5EDG4_9BACT|nr:MAG: 50S ribosomal protein L23 [Candidatus Berkelbacteria bacterium RIFCSPHIGHO2_12_FULL_36_9]